MIKTNMDLNKPLALIVDDEKSICKALSGIFCDESWDSFVAYSGKEGINLFKKHSFDLVLLDVWMKGFDGIQTLQKLKEINSDVPVVIMSGHGTIDTAVKATKLGAFEFLEKPLSLEKLIPMIEHADKLKKLREQGMLNKNQTFQLIGQSETMSAIHRQIKVVAPRNSWVLITGENGTGKEVVARNIHLQSTRGDKEFVAVNCAAIPEDLIESELFGHSKGAFTSAVGAKQGKFEKAHQGTLFLDEIGDMSLKTQSKILRILQEQSFERLGDVETIKVDVRVIAATNKNLQEEIQEGRFREDLYYRLNVIPVHLSPLSERKEDILVLANYFFMKLSLELNEPPKRLSPEAEVCLQAYHWPGNVRELKNLVERLSILVPSSIIHENDLPDSLKNFRVSEFNLPDSDLKSGTLKEARSQFERTFILENLEKFGWNISKTAEEIGIERSNLHRKLKNFGIDLKQLKI